MYTRILGTSGSPIKNRRSLIACRIFEQELMAVFDPALGANGIQIVWVEPALHCDLNRLEEELAKACAAAKATGEDVRMLFGQGCHPEFDSLARKYGIRTSPVKNCIEAFLGDKTKKLEENRTMIMTPTWIRTWPHSVKTFLGWNEVDIRMNLGRYDRILVIDPGLYPLTDEETLDFFDVAQVPIEVMPLDLGLFREIVSKLLE